MSTKSYLTGMHLLPLGRNAPRLISVTSMRQRYTLQAVTKLMRQRGIRHERWTYEQLFTRRRLPRAVYILTDFDRVHPWYLEVASLIRQKLQNEGLVVLNDPRKYMPRDAFLRRLYNEGINSFNCWRPVAGEWPDRFPVFLRTIHAHRGVISDLLNDRHETEAAMEHALQHGKAMSDLMFIEYCAQAQPDGGHFRKFASYAVNNKIIRAATVSESRWIAKLGERGVATKSEYEQDHAEQQSDPHHDVMQRVFELAGMEFGRIDFGLVDGKPEIYELNTNPVIKWPKKHESKRRLDTLKIMRESVIQALADMNYPDPKGHVDLSDIWHRWNKGARGFEQP